MPTTPIPQGLSILSRQQQPGLVTPFLLCLKEVAGGAGVEAAALQVQVTEAAGQLQQQYDARREEVAARTAQETEGQVRSVGAIWQGREFERLAR